MMHLLAQLDPPFTGEQLFDHLSDVVFFVKDAESRYAVVNTTLVERCGVRTKQQLLGRTAAEVLPAPLGDAYTEQDQMVLRTGEPLISQLELHRYPSRDVGWCLTTKLPLRKRGGHIVGLVGVSQDLRLPDTESDDYRHVAKAVAYAERHLHEPPSVPHLASIAQMSRFQLDRRLRRVFGLTAGQWLLKLRIDRAQRLLQASERTIGDIARQVGYEDQSAFARQFRRTTGVAPQVYRELGSATVVSDPS